MAIEQTSMRAVHKPWGSSDLQPWSDIEDEGGPIGELWCQRSGTDSREPALLLKLLFTTQPLSIQVHPDDAFARSIGLAHGKTEAWYVLSATPEAKVAIGLKRPLDADELRGAIENGSISTLVQWRSVQRDDVISIPGGTIHAIGAGIVLAEIQQRSDTTFRLFDYGRQRALHVDDAVAAADTSLSRAQPIAESLSDARTQLIANPHFILERIDLAPNSTWELKAAQETWLLALEGHGRIGAMNASIGKAFFLDADHARIQVEADGLSALVAYPGPEPAIDLLARLDPVDVVPVPHLPSLPALRGRAALRAKEARA